MELSTWDSNVVGIRKKFKPLNTVLATNPARSPNVPPPIAISAVFLFTLFLIIFSERILYPSNVFIFSPHLIVIILILFSLTNFELILTLESKIQITFSFFFATFLINLEI